MSKKSATWGVRYLLVIGAEPHSTKYKHQQLFIIPSVASNSIESWSNGGLARHVLSCPASGCYAASLPNGDSLHQGALNLTSTTILTQILHTAEIWPCRPGTLYRRRNLKNHSLQLRSSMITTATTRPRR